MTVAEETNRSELLARSDVRPAQLAHIVFRTARFPAMRAFYLDVLNARVAYENSFASFLTYDGEHHRVVILEVKDLQPIDKMTSGLEHYAFTYATMGELLANYVRLRDKGIKPVWAINHGFTTSIYYRDPDGNMMETQFDNMTSEEADAFMRGPYFEANPIGVDFDPEVLLEKYRAGVPVQELARFKSAPYAPGVPHIRPRELMNYDGDGALLKDMALV